jgi:hypothetical protein
MALPALKCPFLSQFTLQQVRTSAPHILNAGIESCPVFSQFARKISTTTIHDTTNLSSTMSRPLTLDEIKAVHEKMREQKNPQYASSKVKTTLNTRKPSPFGDSKQKNFCYFLKINFIYLKLLFRLNVKIFYVHF